MGSLRSILLGLLVASTALAGCFGDDAPPSAYQVSASGGDVSEGWAYDGAGLVDGQASLEGAVDVEADTGQLNLTFQAWNSSWTVEHASFSGQEAYKEGGIAQQLTAHGDTGVASTAIPEIRLDLATWGSAEVLRDGQPYAPGGSAGEAWTAHLMFSKDTIRGPDGLISDGNATGPYDPSAPNDARVTSDDKQVIIEVISPDGQEARRAPATVNESFDFAPGMSPQADVPLPTDAYSTATVDVATSGTEGVQAGNITVRFVDPNGTVIEEDSAEVAPNQPYNSSFELTGLTGETTVQIRGMGSYQVSLDARITYDDHSFIVLTMDDYTLEAR